MKAIFAVGSGDSFKCKQTVLTKGEPFEGYSGVSKLQIQ